MWKRIIAGALFLLMTTSLVRSAMKGHFILGIRDSTEIGPAIGIAAIWLIAFVVAVSPSKRLPPDDKNSGQNDLEASP